MAVMQTAMRSKWRGASRCTSGATAPSMHQAILNRNPRQLWDVHVNFYHRFASEILKVVFRQRTADTTLTRLVSLGSTTDSFKTSVS